MLLVIAAKSFEHFVSDRMTEAVVDRFEMIEIEHEHAHRFTLPGMLREQLLRGGEKAAPVERPVSSSVKAASR